MKPIRITKHAKQQCIERGAIEEEVRESILRGEYEPTKLGRLLYRYNFAYSKKWQGKYYAIKQVAPIVKEEKHEIIVITVYTFYF